MKNILEGLPEKGSLSLADEQKLIRRIRATSSPGRRRPLLNKLVLHSMVEAFLYATKCSNGLLPAGATYSICYVALSKASKNFKPARIRFFSYAKVYIRSEIFRSRREDDVIARVPRANILPIESCHFVKQKFDEVVKPEFEDQLFIHEKEHADFDFKSIDAADLRVQIPVALKFLTPTERRVIRLHYFKGQTFEQIGDLLGKHRSWAQVLHHRALARLKRKAVNLRGML